MKRMPHLRVVMGLVAGVSILLIGCQRPVEETKLIGSWQVSVTPSRAIIFTYNRDHTMAVTVTGRKLSEHAAVTGDWRLEGNSLITTMREFTNSFGAETTPLTMFNNASYRIVKLSDSEMIWRGTGQWTGLKLKRSTLSQSAGD